MNAGRMIETDYPRTGAFNRALALVACACLLPACSSEELAPHVILVTLDTTRADALGAFGGPPGLTPHLDEFAAQSVVYSDARTVAPMTLPSHVSMFTGLYPPRHGIRDNGPMFLPNSAQTLAESALEAGYRTGAFVSALALDSAFGLGQGFETYDQPARGSTDSQRPDDETVRHAVSWIDDAPGDQPLFLWVHLFDPHAPYAPSAEYLDRAKGDPYLGDVAAMDAAFGKLMARLRRLPGDREQVIAVAGDHGESRGQHGEPNHAWLCFDSTLHVPVLLYDSAVEKAGGREPSLASVVDIYPTLLRSMGMPAPEGIDGLDLRELGTQQREGLYFETHYGNRAYGWSPIAGWIDEDGKYIHSSLPQFFARPNDPDEEVDLFTPEFEVPPSYIAGIRKIHAMPRLEADQHNTVPADVSASLAALGYTSAGVSGGAFLDPLAPNQLPAPHTRMEVAIADNLANEHLDHGRPDLAAPLLEEILADNPNNPWVLSRFAKALIALGEHERAIPVLQQRLTIAPELVTTHSNMATCLAAIRGDQDLIHKHLRRAMWLMAEASDARGEFEEGKKYRRMLQEALRQEQSQSD